MHKHGQQIRTGYLNALGEPGHEGNTLAGLPSCKNDEHGGAREVFRANRCSVLLIDGFQIALCPACNWLATSSRRIELNSRLQSAGFHVRIR